jgi:hydrogenase expression/formation protein HypE
MSEAIITLDAGSGGKASHRLISGLFLRAFAGPSPAEMDDAALLHLASPLAMSTDSYTIDPLEFPGGDIGSLAIHGTVNDVAMLGAKPLYLSCALIIEEGLPLALLERLVSSMAEAARQAGVSIVTGDTKVVPKGAADKLFINTTGLGPLLTPDPPQGRKAAPGDAIILSGPLGEHGLTILSSRHGLGLAPGLRSDSAALNHIVAALLAETNRVHTLRDPTRGGLATTLNEIALQSQTACLIQEELLPVNLEVNEGCAVLGLDPLYLANEGKFICILPQEEAEKTLHVLRNFSQSSRAAQIGRVMAPGAGGAKAGQVLLETRLGGTRLLPMLEGEQLPRIC